MPNLKCWTFILRSVVNMHSDLKHEWSGEDDGAEKRQQEIIPAVPVWVSGDVLIMQYRCNQHLSLQIRHLGDYHFKI